METINVVKGARIDLTKTVPGLKHVGIGLGWDPQLKHKGEEFDLDSILIGLVGGKFTNPENLVYYNHQSGFGGAAKLSGDNRTGEGAGDDETMTVDLTKIKPEIDQIIIAINIYDAEDRHQNFGRVENAFVRIYDADTNQEICKYDLTEDYSSATGMIMGKLYLHSGEWKFQAIGEVNNGNVAAIAKTFE